jgi:hypothetical protein
MDVQAPLNIAAALATVAGFGYGVWQQRRASRQAAAERDRSAAQSERLLTARACAIWAAAAADLIVQRSKQPGTSVDALADQARGIRGQMRLLEAQLLEMNESLPAKAPHRPPVQMPLSAGRTMNAADVVQGTARDPFAQVDRSHVIMSEGPPDRPVP